MGIAFKRVVRVGATARVKTPIDVIVSSYIVFVYKASSVGSVINFACEPTDTYVRTEALLYLMYLCV